MKLNMLWLYHDILSQNSSAGNIITIKKRCQWRGIGFSLETSAIRNTKEEFNDKIKNADLIYIGSGTEKQLLYALEDSKKKIDKNVLSQSKKRGAKFLLCGNGGGIFGEKIILANNDEYYGFEIFPYSIKLLHKNQQTTGFIHAEINSYVISEVLNQKHRISGFKNHNLEFLNSKKPFINIISYTNEDVSKFPNEGYMDETVIATNISGPLLPRNRDLTDYIIKSSLLDRYPDITLEELSDFEEIYASDKMSNLA